MAAASSSSQHAIAIAIASPVRQKKKLFFRSEPSSSAFFSNAISPPPSLQLPRLRQNASTWSLPCTNQSYHRFIRMAIVEERPHMVSGSSTTSSPSSSILAYEIVQGPLVRWSEIRTGKAAREPPTAVLLHGILGSRRNWSTFAKRLAQEFPTWQFLLVDLRCHGESTVLEKSGPHTVASAAQDILRLIGQLRLTPRVLIGHSFGGKVALSMVDQAAKPLARPVQVWVLDATPGTVRAGGNGEDHPAELIQALMEMPNQIPSRRFVINTLVKKGFSTSVAQWMTTNLRPIEPTSSSEYSWIFNLEGISDMYRSYEATNLWLAKTPKISKYMHVNIVPGQIKIRNVKLKCRNGLKNMYGK